MIFNIDFESIEVYVLAISGMLTTNIAIFGLIIAIMQLQENAKKRKIEVNVIKKEKSLEMMKFFAETITDISYLASVFDEAEDYIGLIKKYKHHEYLDFTYQDLVSKFPDTKDLKILTDNDSFYDKNLNSIAISYIIFKKPNRQDLNNIERFMSINWNDKKIDEYFKKKDMDEEERDIKIDKEKRELKYYKRMLELDFATSVDDCLNSLEYFSAFFISGIADEEFVYPSLHQGFISIVMSFYPKIAKANDKTKADEFFTNITSLYYKWSCRYKKEQDNENNKNIKDKEKRYKNID